MPPQTLRQNEERINLHFIKTKQTYSNPPWQYVHHHLGNHYPGMRGIICAAITPFNYELGLPPTPHPPAVMAKHHTFLYFCVHPSQMHMMHNMSHSLIFGQISKHSITKYRVCL